MRAYQVRYGARVLEEDKPRLDPSTQTKIQKAIESKLTLYPERFAKPLQHSLKGLWALRVGDWRVIFKIHGDQIWIVRIGHRRDVYEKFPHHSIT